MKEILVPVTFDAPELASKNMLNTVLGSAFKVRDSSTCIARSEDEAPYWSAAHFGLDGVDLFKSAHQEEQRKILKLASGQILEEAYFIEKSGMTYTAKMILLSETTQEKMLYSLFSSDEAAHLHHVLSILGKSPCAKSAGPFINLLSDMIREGDRGSLVFLIQVVLEGWGLLHYRTLAENCVNKGVRDKLRLILKDEARHHGSGMIITKANGLDARQKSYVAETLVEFLKLIQCGPRDLVGAMEIVLGHFSTAQRLKIFKELNSEQTSMKKIEIIRSLIVQGGGAEIIPQLEEAGMMKPLAAKECA